MTTSEGFDPFRVSDRRDSNTERRIQQMDARQPAAAKRRKSFLDTPEADQMHAKGMALYQREIDRHRQNRLEVHEDHGFYDGLQMTMEEIAVLEGRGQVPVVYNVIATTVDWVLGTEKRLRTDFKVLARDKENSGVAELKSDALKVVNDVNGTRFSRSRAFKDAVVGGIGWLEDSISDDDTGELIETGFETWRNMHWDSLSAQPDINKDARFVARTKWMDVDVGEAWFPDRKGVIHLAAQQSGVFGASGLLYGDDAMDSQEDAMGIEGWAGSEMGFQRDRFKAIEIWFKRPGLIEKVKGGQFGGELYDPWSRGHADEIGAGRAEVISRPGMQMHCMLMTVAGLLWAGPSPYRHNRFPFTPIWGYRRDHDNMPYGLVRRVKSLQRKINLQKTKEYWILSSNKTIMDEGAVEDLDEYLEESARPDAVIVKRPGKELVINADRQVAPAFGELARDDIGMIQSVGGVTDENRGIATNAKSGIAIERRQDQGSLATSLFFDNLLMARLNQGDIQLSLLEQFYTGAKNLRVMNSRGAAKFKIINADPDGADDITRSKADFVISEDEWRATVRQARFEELWKFISEIAPVDPKLALMLLDLVLDASDFPNRDEMVARVRQLSGMDDPDADQPSPEALAKQQADAEEAQRAIAMQEAEIKDKEASAQAKAAAAAKTQAQVARENVGTQNDAMQAALAIAQAPQVAPVGDQILREGGFVGRSEQEDAAAVEMKAQQLERIALEGVARQAAEQGAAPAPDQPQPPIEAGAQ